MRRDPLSCALPKTVKNRTLRYNNRTFTVFAFPDEWAPRERNFFSDPGDFRLLQMKNLRAHQKAAHEGVRFSCKECHKEFCSKQALRRHGRKCMVEARERKAPKTGGYTSPVRYNWQKMIATCDGAKIWRKEDRNDSTISFFLKAMHEKHGWTKGYCERMPLCGCPSWTTARKLNQCANFCPFHLRSKRKLSWSLKLLDDGYWTRK